MNELEKRAKAHKKKLRGITTLNPNAGNVEYNVSMFNKVNSPVEGPCNNPVSGPFGGDVYAESLDEARDPYFTPYGYKDAAKVLNGKAPEYYYHLKEIEMDQGDGEKLARYARKLGLPVVQDPDDDPDYPTFYILGKYHWNDYFYPYPSNWEPSIDNVVEENMNYNIQFYQIFRSPTSPTENGKMVAQAGTEEEAHQKGVHLCGKGNYLIKAVCDDGKVRYLECFTESLAPKKETIELEYKNLEFTQYGTKRDVDDWDEWDRCMDWTYEVDKDDLYTFIFESCIDETDFLEAFEDEFDPNNPEHWARFESWLDDNFDAIYSKYEDKILKNWEEDAAEEAAEEYDPDDYVDWDSMPGGHDDDRYWEDLKEGEEVFMEKYSYGLNEEYKREPKMIDYFEQMNSEEDEA